MTDSNSSFVVDERNLRHRVDTLLSENCLTQLALRTLEILYENLWKEPLQAHLSQLGETFADLLDRNNRFSRTQYHIDKNTNVISRLGTSTNVPNGDSHSRAVAMPGPSHAQPFVGNRAPVLGMPIPSQQQQFYMYGAAPVYPGMPPGGAGMYPQGLQGSVFGPPQQAPPQFASVTAVCKEVEDIVRGTKDGALSEDLLLERIQGIFGAQLNPKWVSDFPGFLRRQCNRGGAMAGIVTYEDGTCVVAEALNAGLNIRDVSDEATSRKNSQQVIVESPTTPVMERKGKGVEAREQEQETRSPADKHIAGEEKENQCNKLNPQRTDKSPQQWAREECDSKWSFLQDKVALEDVLYLLHNIARLRPSGFAPRDFDEVLKEFAREKSDGAFEAIDVTELQVTGVNELMDYGMLIGVEGREGEESKLVVAECIAMVPFTELPLSDSDPLMLAIWILVHQNGDAMDMVQLLPRLHEAAQHMPHRLPDNVNKIDVIKCVQRSEFLDINLKKGCVKVFKKDIPDYVIVL